MGVVPLPAAPLVAMAPPVLVAHGSCPGDRADRSHERGNDHGQGRQHGRGSNTRQGDGGDRGRGRACRRGRGRGDQGGRGNAFPSPQYNPYMGFFAPYGMTIPYPRHGWVPHNSAGVLSPAAVAGS